MKVRIKFTKHGPIRFIGHLDVMRFFQKAMRRAGIDISYTSGFSPHQIMSFASPLGVGLESNGEYIDIECKSVTTSKDMKDRLNAVSAPGIEVTEVKLLPDTAGNAMASVAAARYTVRFREGREPVCDVCSMINEFLKSETIMITKETKTGIHQVDIKEGIYELTAEKSSGGPVIRLFVDASSAGNIKPAKVIEALLETAGEQLKENALFITREDVYTRIVTDQGDSFISLDQTGRDITEVEASGEFSK